MRKQSLFTSILLLGCFTLTFLSFFYTCKVTVEANGIITTECTRPVEALKNGETLWEIASRQFLTVVFIRSFL